MLITRNVCLKGCGKMLYCIPEKKFLATVNIYWRFSCW